MGYIVFYSWQSDTPTKEGRNLIQRALEMAVQAISEDVQVEEPLREELQVDRDTQDVPGSPPIFPTILEKIEKAAVFVADLTFCGTRNDGNRKTPNPNVLIEYGYALKCVGHSQIIAVMNSAYGKPTRESLPFNLADLRFPLTYNLPDGATDDERKAEREKLAKALEKALRDILDSEGFKAKLPKAAAPAPFPRAAAGNGKARFRAAREPIGVVRDSMLRRMGAADASPVYLIDGAAMWLRLIPASDPGRRWKNLELKQPAMNLVTLPMMQNAGSGFGFVEAEDGCGYWATFQDSQTYAVAFIFHTGEVWITNSAMSRVAEFVELDEEGLARTLDGCASFLKHLGCDKPYRWVVGFEGIKGRQLVVRGRSLGQCVSNVVEDEGTLAEEEKAADKLRPFFEQVYDCCGRTRPGSAAL
jgi:hypothetical protein